jgi:hypothetical protein
MGTSAAWYPSSGSGCCGPDSGQTLCLVVFSLALLTVTVGVLICACHQFVELVCGVSLCSRLQVFLWRTPLSLRV